MCARPFIDSLDFARNGQEINGEVPIAELPRLLDVLEDSRGVLSYTLRGGLDNPGNHRLDISVVGRCLLRCQRCLNGLDYAVQLDTRLLLRDQAGLDALDNDENEFDSILAETHLDILDLLEEEILLSLPIAPKHELDACQVAGVGDAHKKELQPFAVLAKLKSRVPL